jgi:hypothetical protein
MNRFVLGMMVSTVGMSLTCGEIQAQARGSGQAATRSGPSSRGNGPSVGAQANRAPVSTNSRQPLSATTGALVNRAPTTGSARAPVAAPSRNPVANTAAKNTQSQVANPSNGAARTQTARGIPAPRNFYTNYAQRFSRGYYFRSRPSCWSGRSWVARYRCWCRWCPVTCCYYWCAPYNCYYPVGYCPTGEYNYVEPSGDTSVSGFSTT